MKFLFKLKKEGKLLIFVTVGSMKYQFNRLLQLIDKYIEDKLINEEVFAQIGYSDYKPINYKYTNFLNDKEMDKYFKECDIVIAHGNMGALMKAKINGKKVIAVARQSKYNESFDDSQCRIIETFSEKFAVNNKKIE